MLVSEGVLLNFLPNKNLDCLGSWVNMRFETKAGVLRLAWAHGKATMLRLFVLGMRAGRINPIVLYSTSFTPGLHVHFQG